jgi:hypothetical protein
MQHHPSALNPPVKHLSKESFMVRSRTIRGETLDSHSHKVTERELQHLPGNFTAPEGYKKTVGAIAESASEALEHNIREGEIQDSPSRETLSMKRGTSTK